MKIIDHNGNIYEVSDLPGGLNYLTVEFGSPTSGLLHKTKCLVDSGADKTAVTTELLERIGVDSSLPLLGSVSTDTAGGTVEEPITKLDIRISGTDGRSTLFKDVVVTINPSIDAPILGTDITQFFASQGLHGETVGLVFSEKSPSVIQKRSAKVTT